jgi:peptidoglycan-N-acetylglucosamine deacetylase
MPPARAGLAFALALAIALLAPASAALADTSTPTVTLKLKAPTTVRKSAAFNISGTAGSAASSGETITITLSRLGRKWSIVSTTTAVLSAKRAFSAKLKTAQRGHWRVSASVPGTTTHTPSSTSARFKVVGKKVVALTFDDGPWPTTTAQIVRALKKGYAEATFFMLGSQIGHRKKLAQSVVAGGNAIGVHSWNHAIMPRRSSATNLRDLTRCKRAVRSATGVTAHWFRPPYGSTSKRLRKTASKAGLSQVIWSVDTLDWKYRATSSVVSRALAGTRNGSVILMHDGGGPRKATAAAVPIIIKRLRARGYDFVTLDELAALKYKIR